ncbi:hypothetical protein PYH37_000106 [Sinorhizobium numidicum]|uniref:Uncharacterized protein n=1 Tax=Sinorhizobium numidicum TaxID=680248 RepID=A0ABY8CRK0_9HYPH|nr:hypothetical protein [Sinorhizobium numidicum]WEX74819.1 hypothetical protein PYH37_000106 [Sinorhizobium numidicum]WEX80812.1 hypothetical protein PYH38_000108 [Sinorhizobium numidicum]
MLEGPKEFAESSNGDKWFLEHDRAAGEHIVIHRANIASGGTETRWSISGFLEVAGDHPQGQALREALRDIRSLEGEPRSEASLIEPRPSSWFPWFIKSDRAED